MRTTLTALIGAIALADAPAAVPTPFSMQGHTMSADPEIHARAVDVLADLGVGRLRDEIFWANVEREPGALEIPADWSQNLDLMRERGVELLLILDYANPLYDDGMAPHTASHMS